MESQPSGARYFPTYTTIENSPITTLQEIREEAFGYPFYNDGVHRFRLLGDRRKEMSVSDPVDLENPLEIKGFIFHTSHCGSTLLSRMMSALPGVRVVSESEAINSLLLAFLFHQIPEAQVIAHLKAIIEHYRQGMEGKKYLVFKTTSWNVFFIDLFHKIYPEVPWIYIDRNTEKAVDSSLRDGGGFVQWWDYPTDLPRKFFLDASVPLSDKRSYVTSIIDRQRSHVRSFTRGKFELFRYPKFIGEFGSRILPHFGFRFSEQETELARAMTRYQSKSYDREAFEKPLRD